MQVSAPTRIRKVFAINGGDPGDARRRKLHLPCLARARYYRDIVIVIRQHPNPLIVAASFRIEYTYIFPFSARLPFKTNPSCFAAGPVKWSRDKAVRHFSRGYHISLASPKDLAASVLRVGRALYLPRVYYTLYLCALRASAERFLCKAKSFSRNATLPRSRNIRENNFRRFFRGEIFAVAQTAENARERERNTLTVRFYTACLASLNTRY